MEILNSERLLNAVIALERGDDIPAKNVLKLMIENDYPSVLLLYWHATDQIDTTIGELRRRLSECTPDLKVMLKLHKLMLANESQNHG